MSIQIKVREDRVSQLIFDDIEGGRASLSERDGERLIGKVSGDEFEKFLRTNNLILYHSEFKSYEDGEVFGEFQLQS